MKTLVLALMMIFSTTAFARQYIQCHTTDMNRTDVMVVNLPTEDGGTLFISSGMQNPEDERTLVDITFSKTEAQSHVYTINHDRFHGDVTIPSDVIGHAFSHAFVELSFNNFQFSFSCFSSIYND